MTARQSYIFQQAHDIAGFLFESDTPRKESLLQRSVETLLHIAQVAINTSADYSDEEAHVRKFILPTMERLTKLLEMMQEQLPHESKFVQASIYGMSVMTYTKLGLFEQAETCHAQQKKAFEDILVPEQRLAVRYRPREERIQRNKEEHDFWLLVGGKLSFARHKFDLANRFFWTLARDRNSVPGIHVEALVGSAMVGVHYKCPSAVGSALSPFITARKDLEKAGEYIIQQSDSIDPATRTKLIILIKDAQSQILVREAAQLFLTGVDLSEAENRMRACMEERRLCLDAAESTLLVSSAFLQKVELTNNIYAVINDLFYRCMGSAGCLSSEQTIAAENILLQASRKGSLDATLYLAYLLWYQKKEADAEAKLATYLEEVFTHMQKKKFCGSCSWATDTCLVCAKCKCARFCSKDCQQFAANPIHKGGHFLQPSHARICGLMRAYKVCAKSLARNESREERDGKSQILVENMQMFLNRGIFGKQGKKPSCA